jgi:two-component system LytT family response regulator
MLTAIVIDDDDYSRQLVIELMKQYFPEVKIVAESAFFYQGIKQIQKYEPSLIFLDMELPDGLGYEIFNVNFIYPIKVVFITGHKDYACDVINNFPAGYIVKPITPSVFVNIVLKALSMGNFQYPDFSEKLHMPSIRYENDKIVVRTSENIYIIWKENIVRCEAYRNYTTIYQLYEKKILVAQTLKDFEAMLSYPQFIRVHQSHLVNTSYMKRINKIESFLHMADNSRIPIACRKRELLMGYVKSIKAC